MEHQFLMLIPGAVCVLGMAYAAAGIDLVRYGLLSRKYHSTSAGSAQKIFKESL